MGIYIISYGFAGIAGVAASVTPPATAFGFGFAGFIPKNTIELNRLRSLHLSVNWNISDYRVYLTRVVQVLRVVSRYLYRRTPRRSQLAETHAQPASNSWLLLHIQTRMRAWFFRIFLRGAQRGAGAGGCGSCGCQWSSSDQAMGQQATLLRRPGGGPTPAAAAVC